MTETNNNTETKVNPVLKALWTDRNPMQKTGNLGLASGFILGLIGVSHGAAALPVFGLPIFYNAVTQQKGGNKFGLTVLSGVMSLFTVGTGLGVAAVVLDKEIETSSAKTEVVTPAAKAAPVAPAAPSTPPASSNPNPILAKVERQNNAPVDVLNRPKNGGTTTLAQKCEAIKHFESIGALSEVFSTSFQVGFEHALGTMSVDQACAKVGVPT